MEAQKILQGLDKAKGRRLTINNTWEDLAYYVIPRKRGITNKYEAGDKMQFDVYDDTAIQSNLIMAAGLSGYMTNASQRWFQVRPRNESLMNDSDVANFFARTEDIMYSALAASNFYQQIHEFYLDLGSLGTATLYEEEDVAEDIRFYARPPKEIYIVENDKERVDMIYRECEMTAYQAYKKFGADNVGEVIRKAVEETKDYDKTFDFVHHVGPRHMRDVSKKDGKNLPYFSYWVSVADKKIVKESGYEEFPFFVTRFYKNSSEPYGYSPAFVTFPDILMLNKMMKTYIEGAELSIYPPWLLESDSVIGTLDLRAAAINYQRTPLSQGAAAQSLSPKMNAQIAIDFINRTEGNIKAAFFTDLFLMLTQNANMTATEVIERTQEKMLMLGPVLGRLQSELLSPKLKRTFGILYRRGKLPKLPEKLKGQEYDIVYISPLAKAQRAVQAKDMNTFMAVVGQMAGMVPDVLDNVDTDEMVQRLSKIYSVDPEVIRDDETRDIIRNQRAKMQEQEMRLQLLERASGIGKTIKEATPDDRQAARSVS